MSVARDETTPADGGFRRYRGAASDALPRYSVADSITPLRSVGFGAPTTLKATFWHAMIAETPQAGDPAFVSIAYNTGGGRVWRNRETTPTGRGEIAMQPFEGASWRFEWPVSFVHLYLPFSVIEVVCAGLFDRPLAHDDLRMASGIGDDPLCATVDSIRRRLAVTEPTNLLLDSWALILADSLMRRLSSHGARAAGRRLGRMPERRVADVVDLIEAHIDQDLRLESLASAAAMSTYHFARRFARPWA